MSIWALIDQSRMIDIALVLFPMQIVYKLLTLIAIKDHCSLKDIAILYTHQI